MEITFQLILSVLGILFYTLFKARKYIMDKNFVLGIFFAENKKPWLWSFILVLVISLVLFVDPTLGEAIKNLIGIDVSERSSFFTLGYGLSALARNIEK